MIPSAKIKLSNVSVDFPVYSARGLSLKNKLLETITGGRIDFARDGVAIVKSLREINLEIDAGERIGLIGHNGSGKTTLLRVLAGIYQPTHGTADIVGDCASLINIGIGIDPEATGRENITLRGMMLGLTPSQLSLIHI